MTTEAKPEVRLRLIPYNARLVDARKAKGFTQQDLSLLTGINVVKISQLETLRAIPLPDVQNEIAEALEKRPEYLFPPELMESVKDGLFRKRFLEIGDHRILKGSPEQLRGLLPSPEPDFRVEVEGQDLNRAIMEAMATLSPRMQKILTMRFGLDGKGSHTCEEVGREFNVTGGRIQQIEHQALRRMRHPCRSRRLKIFIEGLD